MLNVNSIATWEFKETPSLPLDLLFDQTLCYSLLRSFADGDWNGSFFHSLLPDLPLFFVCISTDSRVMPGNY